MGLLILCVFFFEFIGKAVTNTGLVFGEGRISQGSDAYIEDFPFQASLYLDGVGFICGATIISKSSVLTAALCFRSIEDEEMRDVQIRVGSAQRESGGELYYAEYIIIHEEFDEPTRGNNNIALIILTDDLVYSSSIRPVFIPRSGWNEVPPGKEVYVSGWGYTGANAQDLSDTLQYAKIEIIDPRVCEEIYSRFTENMLCAGTQEGGRNACAVCVGFLSSWQDQTQLLTFSFSG